MTSVRHTVFVVVFFAVTASFAASSVGQSVVQEGTAFYIPDRFSGRATTSGEPYDPSVLTAAHRTLPIGTMVRVMNAGNGKEVVVRVNDRGPFVSGRVIDVSEAAAQELEFDRRAGAYVKLTIVDGSIEPEARALTHFDRTGRKNTEEVVAEGEKRYTIQLGSYSEVGGAREYAGGIEGAWVQAVSVDGQTFFRVNFGVYGDERSAQAGMGQIGEQGLTGFVKTIDKTERDVSDN